MTETTGSQSQPSQPSKSPWEQAWNDVKDGMGTIKEAVVSQLPASPPNPRMMAFPWEKRWNEPKTPEKPKTVAPKQSAVASGDWGAINQQYAAGQGQRDLDRLHLLRTELAREKNPDNRAALKREIGRIATNAS